jgi:hypothetical protein
MNQEPLETAVCAASDLAARLAGELAEALCQLEDADRRFLQATADAQVFGTPIPFQVRRERIERRRAVALFRHVLDELPATAAAEEGGHHAASA